MKLQMLNFAGGWRVNKGY